MKLPIAKLTSLCPTASSVFLWLLERVARTGSRRVVTNLDKIGAGIGKTRGETITKALKALTTCKLIKYRRKTRKDSGGNYSGAYLEIVIGEHTLSVLTVTRFSLGEHTKSVCNPEPSSCANPHKACGHLLRDSGAVPSATATVPSPMINPAVQALKARESNGSH